MVSHHTIPMLNKRPIRVLHLESTDVCQAACPLCARETDAMFNKASSHHLTMSQILKIIDKGAIRDLDKMFMCGNYGDPAAGRHTLEIFQEFRAINPNITLGINSNGGLQNANWWKNLAGIMTNPNDYAVFSIDGLEDTNHLYRVNVNWSKVMENVQSFIAAGGSAHWDMLIYDHNQHQVDSCESLARRMGFRWFRAKVSRRPFVGNLFPPRQWTVLPMASKPIQCHALEEKSFYIDARGIAYPCCWLGHRSSTIRDLADVQETWTTDSPNTTCLHTCGTVKNSTSFLNQWRRSVELIN